MKILAIIAAIFGAAVVWVMLASALWGFSVATAGIYGRGEAHKQIQSAGSRIANYNHFFNLCAAIQSDEASLDAQFTALAMAETTSDRSRIQTNIAALQANRARGINQYNVNARKDYTAGQFRDSDLPYQLPTTDYTQKGEKTSCGSS